MAVPKKLVMVPNPATRELWRIAESGEIEELEAVLSRAEVNARNEHGMTALMRAARQGRVEMVRILLERGADPNVVRGDNFTALSLAAFFGHTEIVEVLLKHGARTDVATRYGTSPYLWAKARSFGDVVRCIEKGANQIKPVQPAVKQPSLSALKESLPQGSPPPNVEVRTLTPNVEVRTLKDPPEIWDLVHEAPQQFKPGSAFVTRIRSIGMSFVLRAAALLLVVAVGTLAVLSWKGALRSSPVSSSVKKSDTSPQQIVSPPLAPVASTESAAAPVVATDTNTVEPVNVETSVATQGAPAKVTRRSRSLARLPSTQLNAPSVNTIETAPAPAPPVVVSKPATRTENVTKNKPDTPLNPQMISPPKSAQPKGKVIQWP